MPTYKFSGPTQKYLRLGYLVKTDIYPSQSNIYSAQTGADRTQIDIFQCWAELCCYQRVYLGWAKITAAQGRTEAAQPRCGPRSPASLGSPRGADRPRLGRDRPPASERHQITRRPRADCNNPLPGVRQGLAGPCQAGITQASVGPRQSSALTGRGGLFRLRLGSG